MRLVKWEDENGYMRQSYVKDGDPDEMAVRGIRHEPPDLSRLDWEAIKRDLHNELLRLELIGWNDVMRQQNTLLPALGRVLKRHVLALYRE